MSQALADNPDSLRLKMNFTFKKDYQLKNFVNLYMDDLHYQH